MIIRGKRTDTEELIDITIEGQTITAIAEAQANDVDLGDNETWISPAFIDVQINGVGGISYRDKALTVEKVVETTDWIYKTGTGQWCPTITTSAADEAIHSLQTLVNACKESPLAQASFVGFHVEGPYISSEDGPRGAHPLEHTRNPDWDEFCRYQEAAAGRVAILTVAPEREGALAFIEKVADSGVTVSIGHSGASRARIREAVSAGAAMSTHLGNGAHATLPRHDNYLWEQLAADELWAGIIPDGHHLPEPVLKSIYRAKQKNRICLVSDAASIAGLPPGIYDKTYGSEAVEIHPNGKIALAGTPYLAGAGLFLDHGIATMTRFSDATLIDAIDMATRNPTRLLNLTSSEPRIEEDQPATLTLFRWEPGFKALDIQATLVQGEVVFQTG
ncbi:MAG: amidohydrolase family protein [Chloroflexota bacterium]